MSKGKGVGKPWENPILQGRILAGVSMSGWLGAATRHVGHPTSGGLATGWLPRKTAMNHEEHGEDKDSPVNF